LFWSVGKQHKCKWETAAQHTINIDTTAMSVSFHSIQTKDKFFTNTIFLKLKKIYFLSQPSENLKMLTYEYF